MGLNKSAWYDMMTMNECEVRVWTETVVVA